MLHGATPSTDHGGRARRRGRPAAHIGERVEAVAVPFDPTPVLVETGPDVGPLVCSSASAATQASRSSPMRKEPDAAPRPAVGMIDVAALFIFNSKH